jgi:hypothetical protein
VWTPIGAGSRWRESLKCRPGRNAAADNLFLVTGARVGSQQNLRALELARRMLAAAQERREFAALGLAEFDAVAYIQAD